MRFIRAIPFAVAGFCIATTSAMAQQDNEELVGATNTDWVSLTGEVKSVSDSSFILDYGKGEVAVEMDDFDWRDENAVAAGDDVTVTGMIDQDFYEGRKIEASSVFVDKLNTYFYASSADEEGGYYSYPVSAYGSDDEWLIVTGSVVRKDDETLTIDTGARVSVYGDDADLFEGHELIATSVVRLSEG